MNNSFFDIPLLRILNTFLLAGILVTQVLILLHIREPIPPIRVREPVDVEVTNEPSVEITNEPSVEIANEPLQVEIVR
jgi:hypothetical protein